MSKQFNDAFRRALRPEPEAEIEVPPSPKPARAHSIDAGAGTQGTAAVGKPSMNDLIRRAARDRE